MWRAMRNWRRGSVKKERLAALVLLTGALIGLLAAFVLSVEALVAAGRSDVVLSCDINAVLSCSAVASHWSAKLLGFPNSLIGLATLPVVVTIGVALLAGVKFPRWFMRAAQYGVLAGLLFAGWMFYMSLSVIQVLCPWCLVTDVAMLLMVYGMTRHNVLSGVINWPWLRRMVEKQFDTAALFGLVALGVALIIGNFSMF